MMTQRLSYDYVTYDVFTDTPFGGNPLAIVWDADALSSEAMQIIAREFNYSETVFILKPVDAAHTARLRIFTPNSELPFAGHPTIGAIVALSERAVSKGIKDDALPGIQLELKVGTLDAKIENGLASFKATQSLERLAEPDVDLIAKVIGCAPDEIMSQPIMASMGVPFTFTEVSTRAALSKVQIDLIAMRDGNARYPSGRDFSQAVFWREQAGADQKTAEQVLHLRMFAPLDSIPEDPATGSAAAALATLMFEQVQQPLSLKIFQGADMGRPSMIYASADATGVTIRGGAVKIMQGQISI